MSDVNNDSTFDVTPLKFENVQPGVRFIEREAGGPEYSGVFTTVPYVASSRDGGAVVRYAVNIRWDGLDNLSMAYLDELGIVPNPYTGESNHDVLVIFDGRQQLTPRRELIPPDPPLRLEPTRAFVARVGSSFVDIERNHFYPHNTFPQ